MAKRTHQIDHSPTVPAAVIEDGVMQVRGVSAEYDLAGCASEFARNKVGAAAIAGMTMHASPDAPLVDFEDGTPLRPLLGRVFDDNRAVTYIGTVMADVDAAYAKKNKQPTPEERDLIASRVASINAAHEISHLVDRITIGKAKLERADRRYERMRLAGQVMSKVAALGAWGILLAAGEAAAILQRMPWWVHVGIGVIGVKDTIGIVKALVKSQKPMTNYRMRQGEKKYLNHLEERRARRRAERYRRALNRGQAPLLLKITTVSPSQP